MRTGAGKGDGHFPKQGKGLESSGRLKLALNVTSEAGLTGDISNALDPGVLVVNANLSRRAVSKREGNFKFETMIKDADIKACDSAYGDGKGEGLQGELGIRDWLSGLEAMRRNTQVKPFNFNYTAEFLIVETGGLGPKLSLLPIGGSKLGAGLNLSRNSSSTNTLILAIVEVPKPQPAKPLLVSITNSPEEGVGKKAAGRSGARKSGMAPATAVEGDDPARKALESAIDRNIQSNQTIVVPCEFAGGCLQ